MLGGGGGGKGPPSCKALVVPRAARTELMKSSCFARQLDFGGAISYSSTTHNIGLSEKS